MTVGEKIRKYRKEKGLSQKDLAIKCKMSEPAIRNYELGNRTPNEKQLEIIALALGVSIYAISDPNLDTEHGVMHAFYYLEENYNFKIKKEGSEVSLVCNNIDYIERMSDWAEIYNKFKSGEITEEEYQEWKDTYPEKTVYNKK